MALSPARAHILFGIFLVFVIVGGILLYFSFAPKQKQCYEKLDESTCEGDCRCIWCQSSCYQQSSAPCTKALSMNSGCSYTDPDVMTYHMIVAIVASVLGTCIGISWCIFCCVTAKPTPNANYAGVPENDPALQNPQATQAAVVQPAPAFAQAPFTGGQPMMMTAVPGPDGQPQYILSQVPPQYMSNQLPPQQYVVSYQPVYM